MDVINETILCEKNKMRENLLELNYVCHFPLFFLYILGNNSKPKKKIEKTLKESETMNNTPTTEHTWKRMSAKMLVTNDFTPIMSIYVIK